jgi:hypothetical protein
MNENHILVVFDDGTHSIIKDMKDKMKNSKKANLEFSDGSWHMGTIVYRGPLASCKKRSLILDGDFVESGQEDISLPATTNKKANKNKQPKTSKFNPLNLIFYFKL